MDMLGTIFPKDSNFSDFLFDFQHTLSLLKWEQILAH